MAYFVASLDTVAVQHGRAQVVHKYGELLVIGRSVSEALSMHNVRLDELVQLEHVRGPRKVQPFHNVQVGILKFNRNVNENEMLWNKREQLIDDEWMACDLGPNSIWKIRIDWHSIWIIWSILNWEIFYFYFAHFFEFSKRRSERINCVRCAQSNVERIFEIELVKYLDKKKRGETEQK